MIIKPFKSTKFNPIKKLEEKTEKITNKNKSQIKVPIKPNIPISKIKPRKNKSISYINTDIENSNPFFTEDLLNVSYKENNEDSFISNSSNISINLN